MRLHVCAFGAIILVAACSHDAAGPALAPTRIQLDSLRSVEDTALPCCTTVAGALTFFAPVHFDTANSPGGPAEAGCVLGVPNGELVDLRRGVATSSDSVTIPLFGCETGSFRLTVRHAGAKGDSLAQAGYFAWAVDSAWHSGTLTLIDTIGGLYWNVKVTGTTFTVPFYHFTPGGYGFQVVAGYDIP
ncbi:MAG TPA: hypothetical protein VFD85_09060 [Gemmatimonadales bacterium]|nr:hypothetical protein [Gemmatimonadales bacterium]